MKASSPRFIRRRDSQALTLGVFSLFLLSCNQEAGDDPNQRTEDRLNALDKRAAHSINTIPDRSRNANYPQEYLQLVADNEGQLSNLIDYCVNHVPDSNKADFMISIAEAAGRESDISFMKNLLISNPGAIKNYGIEAYARNVNGRIEINSVLGLVTEDLLPEEQEAIWKGILDPMIRLPIAELKSLYDEGALPVEFRERASHVIGINLGKSDPKEAGEMIRSYPSEMQKSILSTYWRQISATNPDVARQAFEAGSVPEQSWTVVGRGVISQIIRDDSLDAALSYALARENKVQEKTLSNYVFDLWMKNDSIAASQRAALLPPGPALDGAAKAVALRLEMLGDKEGAKQWRAQIQKK